MQTEQQQKRDFLHQPQEIEINLFEYCTLLRKRAPIIIAVVVIILAAQLLRLLNATPVYTASTTVLVEAAANPLEGRLYRYYDPKFLQTQTMIITSEDVARKVVENLQLDSKYKKFFLKERSRNVSLLRRGARGIKRLLTSLLHISDRATPASQTATQGSLSELASEPFSEADIIANIIRSGMTVSQVPESDMIVISYSNENPALAKLVANEIVSAYKSVSLEIKHSASNYSLQWMTKKAAEERAKLEAAEIALQKYKRDNNLVTVEDKLAVVPQKLAQINRDYLDAQTRKKEIEDVNQQIQNAKGNLDLLLRIPFIETSASVQNIRKSILESKQNIEELSKRFGYKHPTMKKAKDDLAVLQRELRSEVNRQVAAAQNSAQLAASKEASLEEQLARAKVEMMNVNDKSVQLSIMQREVDTNRAMYDALMTTLKRTGVTEKSQDVQIWVVRKAEMPGAPSYPRKKRAMAMALAIGLAVGFGLAFFIEFLDNTIKSEKDLLARFQLTILGMVIQLKKGRYSIDSVLLRQPLSPVAESYRLVRTNLLLSSAERPPQKILITSMGPGEGKTTSSVNIARVLSQGDKKVAIIDCDLRKPRTHSLLGVDNRAGLSNYLTGNRIENLLLDIPGESIKLIPSGPIPPNPAELLSSRKMKALVDKMSEYFDFVILDTPPVQVVTDCLVLSPLVDGMILVVRSGKTTYDMLSSGLKKLNDVNAHILGFLLNGVKDREARGGYYSGYNSYYAKDDSKDWPTFRF